MTNNTSDMVYVMYTCTYIFYTVNRVISQMIGWYVYTWASEEIIWYSEILGFQWLALTPGLQTKTLTHLHPLNPSETLKNCALNTDILLQELLSSVFILHQAGAPGFHHWGLFTYSLPGSLKPLNLKTISSTSPFTVNILDNTEPARSYPVNLDCINHRITE